MSFCTPEEIILIKHLKPQQFQLDKDDIGALHDILDEWISQAEDLIENYCEKSFQDDDVPPGVKNVCIRLVSNMVNYKELIQSSPIIKVNDWKVERVSSAIFTDDLKHDLKPYKRKRKVQVFKI